MASYPVLVDPSRSDSLLQLANDTDGLNAKLASQKPTETVGWVAPVIALLQLGATVGSWFWNRSQQREQNEYQRQLIDEQNAYNSPAAQLNRLIGAGIPANTALASLTGSVGSQTQPMSGQAAPYTPVQPPSLGELSSLATLKDQHDLAQAQVRNLDADSYSKDPENPFNVAQRVLHENQAILAGKQANLTDSQRQQADEMTVLIMKQQQTEFWKAEKEFLETKNYDRWMASTIKSMEAATGLSYAQCWSIFQKTALELRMEGVQRELFSSQASSYRSSARLSNAEAAIKEVKDGDIPAMARSILLQNLAASQENDIRYFWNRPIMLWSEMDAKSFGTWSAAVQTMSTSEAMRNKRYTPVLPDVSVNYHRGRDSRGKRWGF